MKLRFQLFAVIFSLLVPLASAELLADSVADGMFPGRFDPSRDLYIPQFDSKTDVDDLHSVAGVATMLRHPAFEDVRFHAVQGTYGMQEGLFVPAPELMEMAFGENHSDAHVDREGALERVLALVTETLEEGGSVWVAEAGQSDFTADWVWRAHEAGLDTRNVHVVQHSDWNESVTTPSKLALVKELATYHRIEDGNVEGNGTPGLNSPDGSLWALALSDPATADLWREARRVGNRYNGADDRYLNPSIEAGGIDFSDVSESCWIFGYESLQDVPAFFATFFGRD